jgi:hypothetical protein
VHAMGGITTGGGFLDNIPRVPLSGADVVIREGSWPVPPVFGVLERGGRFSFEEMPNPARALSGGKQRFSIVSQWPAGAVPKEQKRT